MNNNKVNTEQELKQEKSKIKKSKVKKIFIYIILALVAIYILYAIYLLIKQPTDIFTVEQGKLYQEEINIGYVIREEQVVKGDNYKNGMEKIKLEGERAAKEEAIFRYYSTNEDNLEKQISKLDEEIQKAIQSDNSLFSPEIKVLEGQIDEKLKAINEMTETSKLEEYKKAVNELVTKKAKIAGESSPKGSYLNQLINQRKAYENQLNSGMEYIKAPSSGIVSYRVDGLEDTLTPNSFSDLTKEYLEKLDLKTGKIVTSSEECGKVINNFYCYIATISSSEQAKNAKVGDNVKVRLANNVEISAEITNIGKENDDDVLLVLKIEKEVQELINYRKISFDLIWWSYSGLKVPNQAIGNIDGLNYIARNRAGYISKLLVKIKKQNDRYSIVESYDTDELRELGFTNSEISKDKKITLYDEILLNPDFSKIV